MEWQYTYIALGIGTFLFALTMRVLKEVFTNK